MNDRVGEHLWSEWDGELYESDSVEPTVYYTNGHIDADHDIIKRALASAIQRDGVADSLADAFRMIDTANVSYGWVGMSFDKSLPPTVCDENGETYYGDIVDTLLEVTFVELM